MKSDGLKKELLLLCYSGNYALFNYSTVTRDWCLHPKSDEFFEPDGVFNGASRDGMCYVLPHYPFFVGKFKEKESTFGIFGHEIICFNDDGYTSKLKEPFWRMSNTFQLSRYGEELINFRYKRPDYDEDVPHFITRDINFLAQKC